MCVFVFSCLSACCGEMVATLDAYEEVDGVDEEM